MKTTNYAFKLTIETPFGRFAPEFGRICAAASEGMTLEQLAAWTNQHCQKLGAYRGGNHVAIHSVGSDNRLEGPRMAMFEESPMS